MHLFSLDIEILCFSVGGYMISGAGKARTNNCMCLNVQVPFQASTGGVSNETIINHTLNSLSAEEIKKKL